MIQKNTTRKVHSLDRFHVLIVCRGPIAMEAMELARELGMPPPELVVSKREVYESAGGRAPWTQHRGLYGKIHIIDDYKDQEAIIAIARRNRIDAVYVGYGYSAERSEFIAALEQSGIIPIAPPSDVMAFSGSKFRAKRRVRDELGIRVLPGSDKAAELALDDSVGDERLIESVTEEARSIFEQAPGQVIRLKAVKGGGGKGQRLITRPDQVAAAVQEVWAEIAVRGVDGDKGILVEANLAHPRHWEVQVLSDGETVVHFAARECSIQNRGSQKFIELSLHPGQYDHYLNELDSKSDADLIERIHEEQRRIEETCNHAVEIIGSLGYRGAATVEFLVAEDGGAEILGKPHFMEINSRIQVEHRVSEAVSLLRGKPVRLVGEQYRIAAGQKLGYKQDDISFEGYAIETRINASNPNFLIGASGSVIERYRLPPRDENFYYDDGGAAALFASGTRRRWEVPNFDSNFGLAVFRGATQDEAFARAEEALLDFEIEGNEQLRTTLPFHLGVLAHLRHSAPYGKIRTDFSEIFLAFGATTHHLMSNLGSSGPAAGDPLRRLLLRASDAMRTDPGLAIAVAYRRRRLQNELGKDRAGMTRALLTYLARLTQCRLFDEERAAIEATAGELPAAIEEIIDAVEASEIFDFKRNDDDLDFFVPENVRDPHARYLLIEELRDSAVQSVKPRSLSAREIEELKYILLELQNRAVQELDEGPLLKRLDEGARSCMECVENNSHMSPAEFEAFYERLRRVKWGILKGGVDEQTEASLMHEVNRAVKIVRGPNVVAQLAGTIYLRPSPDKPCYIEVGDEVVEDETVVALLENMKMFNEIRAHMSGRVKEILVENERPVLPGDVILVIE